MVSKKYSPAHVVNPISEIHSVYLCPTQRLILTISDWMDVDEVQCDSNFLELSNASITEKERKYEFVQIGDYSDWSKISSTFLGEIILIGEKIANSVCVLLASQSPNIITLINPELVNIKLSPQQLLEVVFYESNSGFERFNNCSILGTPQGLEYEHRGSQVIEGDSNFTFESHMVVARNKQEKEYHMWFGLSRSSGVTLLDMDTGIYYAGMIRFGETIADSIKIHLNVKSKLPKPISPKKSPKNYYQPTSSYYSSRSYYAPPTLSGIDIIEKSCEEITDGCQLMSFKDIVSWKDPIEYD